MVDLQRWLKALGVYTPEVTTWLLKCTPEGIPVTDPKITDPYALPSVNFFAPVGTAPPPSYRPHQFLTNVYVHPATYLLEVDAVRLPPRIAFRACEARPRLLIEF